MNPWIGWTLAVAVLALGYVQYGWRGAAMALSVVVFWLLLQFNRALRVMQNAGRAPVGHVPSAVMLNARLKAGMRMIEVVTLTRSLGQRVDAAGAQGELWRWQDAGGVAVEVALRRGRVAAWTLLRPADADAGADASAA